MNYVYENIEVKKTGRTASRTIGTSTKIQVVVEITPTDEDDGTWKKWVNPDQLFVIRETEK